MISIYDAVFVLAYGIGFAHFMTDHRQKMMAMKFAAASLMFIYFSGTVGPAAALSSVIVMLGAFMQGIFPEHMLEKTKLYRGLGAVILAVAGGFLVADSMADLWPLMAVGCARLSEVQSKVQRIRIGLLVAQSFWLVFAIEEGLLLLFAGEFLGMLLNLSMIWRYEQRQKRMSPAVASASS